MAMVTVTATATLCCAELRCPALRRWLVEPSPPTIKPMSLSVARARLHTSLLSLAVPFSHRLPCDTLSLFLCLASVTPSN